MRNLALLAAASSLITISPPAAAQVTPMTPDVVASYDPIMPFGRFRPARGDGANARWDQALHGDRDEEGDDGRTDPPFSYTL
jgi:hypothetical protein